MKFADAKQSARDFAVRTLLSEADSYIQRASVTNEIEKRSYRTELEMKATAYRALAYKIRSSHGNAF